MGVEAEAARKAFVERAFKFAFTVGIAYTAGYMTGTEDRSSSWFDWLLLPLMPLMFVAATALFLWTSGLFRRRTF